MQGAAWSLPVIALGAPAAFAGPSQCSVGESYTLGPLVQQPIRAVCSYRSQWPVVTDDEAINLNYGTAYLPAYLQICNCQQDPGWYRWREVDTRSNFQIEVDGVHNDQNSSTAGYRPAFWLNSFGAEGGCRQFTLTYRTSTRISRDETGLSGYGIRWTLQRHPSTDQYNPPSAGSGLWGTIRVFDLNTVRPGGWVRRNERYDNVDFGDCDHQTLRTSSATVGSTSTTTPSVTTDGAGSPDQD